MKKTKDEFKKRCVEVDKYLDALLLLDKGNCQLTCTDLAGNAIVKQIDTDLARILKANAFLLLYNLIEATIRNSIQAIINSINGDKLEFAQISDKVQELWLRQEISDIKNTNQNYQIISGISQKILAHSLLSFKEDCIKISGNMDAKAIRKIAKQFGYQEPKDGRGLVQIKEKRNKLAHGEYTFTEVGKNYTISDISILSKEAKEYIDDVLLCVENYILKKSYKKIS